MKFGKKINAERNITQMSVNHIHVKKKFNWNGTGCWETLMAQHGCKCSSDQAHCCFSIHARVFPYN